MGLSTKWYGLPANSGWRPKPARTTLEKLHQSRADRSVARSQPGTAHVCIPAVPPARGSPEGMSSALPASRLLHPALVPNRRQASSARQATICSSRSASAGLPGGGARLGSFRKFGARRLLQRAVPQGTTPPRPDPVRSGIMGDHESAPQSRRVDVGPLCAKSVRKSEFSVSPHVRVTHAQAALDDAFCNAPYVEVANSADGVPSVLTIEVRWHKTTKTGTASSELQTPTGASAQRHNCVILASIVPAGRGLPRALGTSHYFFSRLRPALCVPRSCRLLVSKIVDAVASCPSRCRLVTFLAFSVSSLGL